MATSGTYSYDPLGSDLGLDAFGRLQIRSASITPEHIFSLRRSANSVQVRWANRGVNLWSVDQIRLPLIQGVSEYAVPGSTVMMLETLLRTYSLGGVTDFAPAFATTIASRLVTVVLADNGFVVGGWISIPIPVAIGGIVVQGFYQVSSVLDADTFTFLADDAASSTTASGGAVPLFTTTAASATVTATLAAHGLAAGESWDVQVPTLVGGVWLSGTYTVATVPTANTFTFAASYAAGAADSGLENSGEAQIAGQATSTAPTDRLLMPFSRDAYAAVAVKTIQAAPTNFYFARTIAPTVTIWPLPDSNGPYELVYNRMRQMQDADLTGLGTIDMPYRFIEAFTAGLAAHLAITWRPENFEKLDTYAKEVWEEAAHEDRQRVDLSLNPDFSGYFR